MSETKSLTPKGQVGPSGPCVDPLVGQLALWAK
jgi:hypothetical protein